MKSMGKWFQLSLTGVGTYHDRVSHPIGRPCQIRWEKVGTKATSLTWCPTKRKIERYKVHSEFHQWMFVISYSVCMVAFLNPW